MSASPGSCAFRRTGGSCSLTTSAGSAAAANSSVLSVVRELLMGARWLSVNDLTCLGLEILAETSGAASRYFLLALLRDSGG